MTRLAAAIILLGYTTGRIAAATLPISAQGSNPIISKTIKTAQQVGQVPEGTEVRLSADFKELAIVANAEGPFEIQKLEIETEWGLEDDLFNFNCDVDLSDNANSQRVKSLIASPVHLSLNLLCFISL